MLPNILIQNAGKHIIQHCQIFSIEEKKFNYNLLDPNMDYSERQNKLFLYLYYINNIMKTHLFLEKK